MNDTGKVITARGAVEPEALGRVLMHEHLYCDCWDWANERIPEEAPITPRRRRLLMEEAVPNMRKLNDYGCHAFVDATPPPFRTWPSVYAEVSEAAEFHMLLSTGCYREVETGTYWVKTPEDAIWKFAREASVKNMADLFIGELLEGIHGTQVRAGVIKLASSGPELTETEAKAFRAGAEAQKATGVHITTHCPSCGSEDAQLRLLVDECGVDPARIVLGHVGRNLIDPKCRRICLDWMRRGANFLPTNLDVAEGPEPWRPLVEAIHEVFDAGQGDKLCLGLDWAFTSESGEFGLCPYMPPPPFLYMFTDTLPAFRKLGLTQEEEDVMLLQNPQRILPVRAG
ncbi:MAG: hypothetical protein J7M08_06635 [Planctomycetes bacterium]|nr:hypothetical protein [Planctomycetota bacterium]